jgi:tetratricopeptide (TPR) repeat protein
MGARSAFFPMRMKSAVALPELVLLVALAFLPAGCRTAPRSNSGTPAPAARPVKEKAAPALSESEWETRVNALSRFAAGVSAEMRGQSQEALEAYRAAALADPANEELVLEVAGRLLRARQAEPAVDVLTRASQVRGAGANIFAWLSSALIRAGRPDQALTACRRALQLDPGSSLARQNLLNLHLQAGRLEEARRAIEDAERRAGSSAEWLDVSDHYSRLLRAAPKETETLRPRALAALARAEHLAGDDVLAWLRLGEGYSRLADHRSAIIAYERVLGLRPGFPGIREKLVEACLRADENEKAQQYLRDIVGDSPSNPRLHYLLGTVAAEETRPERRTDKLKEAATHFEKTLALNPNFEPAYYDLARVRLSLNEADAALKTLQAARTLFGDTYLVELLTAMAHGQKKEYAVSLRHYTAAELIARTSETNRLNEGLYFQLGAAHERNKDYATAEKYFRKALELAPDFAEALNYLGYMWAERGENLQEAQRLIEKAVQLEPENGAFLDSMAWVLYQQGKVREALPWMEKALKHSPEPDPTLYDHLGDIYWKLGRPEPARDAWRKSLELEDNPAVRKKLELVPGRPLS